MRSAGFLINLQPYAERMDVEVRFGDERSLAGSAVDCPAKLADMQAALRSVSELTTAGLFSLRDQTKWHFETQIASPEEWAEFVTKPTCGGIEADSERLAAALARPDGCIVLTEPNLAAVYHREGA